MNKILAIAVLTIRSSVRSRMFAAALLAVIAVIAGLPFVMRGDGTPQSLAAIFINYAFGLMMFVLSLAATWNGAGAISLEMSGRQMQMLVTKPLNAFCIWLGKLLGLLALNLALLVLGGILICAMLHWTLRPANLSKTNGGIRNEIMTVYRPVAPSKTPRSGADPVAIGPGEAYRWSFNLTERAAKTSFMLIKFRFMPSPFSHQSPVAGAWRAFTEKNVEIFNRTGVASPHLTASFAIPGPFSSAPRMLEYANLQTNPPVTIFFPSTDDLQLLIPESSFEANLARGLLMGFARLAFFTSLGMIAGGLFSFPVAVFLSMGLLVMSFSEGMIRQLAEHGLWMNPPEGNLLAIAAVLNDMTRALFSALASLLPALDRFDPAALLSNSLFIPWNLVGQSFVVLCVLYPLLLTLVGSFCLSRKEVAAASI